MHIGSGEKFTESVMRWGRSQEGEQQNNTNMANTGRNAEERRKSKGGFKVSHQNKFCRGKLGSG